MDQTSSSLLHHIKNQYFQLKTSEKKVADYVLQRGFEVAGQSLASLSNDAGVSEPTVIRFTKKLGFSGFSDFKLALAREWGRESAMEQPIPGLLVDLHVSPSEKLDDIPAKMIGLTRKALGDTLELISLEQYKKAVEMISNARIIDIYGVGNSASVAADMTNKLLRIGLICRQYSDNHLQQICASHLTRSDLAIAISHSGSTIDTVNTLRIAKESGAMTIALTNFKGSHISKYADITLYTGDVETTFYSETMVSRISQLAIVDMLYTGVLLSNYEEYARRLGKINMLVQDKNYLKNER